MNALCNRFHLFPKGIKLIGFLLFPAMGMAANNKALLFPFTFGNTNVENAIIQKYEAEPEAWVEEGLLLVAFCYARNGQSNKMEKVWGNLSEQVVSDYIRMLKVDASNPHKDFLLRLLATNGVNRIIFPTASHSTLKAIIDCYKANPGIWDVGQLDFAGGCHYNDGDFSGSAKAYERKFELAPTDADTIQAFVTALLASEDYPKAEMVAANAWEMTQNARALEYLSIVKIMRRDVKGLAPLIDDLLKHQKESEQIRIILLGYALEADDIKLAKKIYDGVKTSVNKEDLEENADLRRAIVKASLYFEKLGELTSETEDSK